MSTSTATDSRPARRARTHLARLVLALPFVLGLASCDDGTDSSGSGLSCSTPDQETALAGYFSTNYLWAATSPYFPPQTPALSDYFNSLLYTGGDPDFPAGVTDVWSSYTTDDNFNLLYVNGQDLGYGVFVNGIEAEQDGATLAVRYVDPGSPADVAGVARGDTVVSVNGVPAAQLVTSDDFSGLSSDTAGQTLTLVTSNAAGTHTNTLTSAVYTLTPVQGTRVLTSPTGRSIGYLMITDAIDQAIAPYDSAFAQFKSANVQDVVVDMRYTGAGTVQDGETMASYPDTAATSGATYVNLYFNEFVAGNSYYTFDAETNGLALPRVFVLTGPRTCGVAEQFVNGLSPLLSVVTIGDTTCGKPVGTTPASNCGTTYSIMTFQVANGVNSGQYFSGLPATCSVAEDLSVPIGDDADPLLAGAVTYADTGACGTNSGAGVHRHAPMSRLAASWLEPMNRR